MNDTNPATTANLLLIHREALAKVLATDFENPILSYGEHTALRGLLNACPERRLVDGIYEVPDVDGNYYLRYVRDGRQSAYRGPDGTLYGVGCPLPADVSGWRLIAPASAFTSE